MSLQARALTVRHGRTQVLQDVDISLAQGVITGLIGPNGVGKSSLLRCLAGLAPSHGEVALDGQVLGRVERLQHVAYMPQDTSAGSSLTLMEVVLLGRAGALGLRLPKTLQDEAYRALDSFGLGALAHRTLAEVSGGQRQLTYLAQALFREPRVLMLDEPTAALDLRHQLVVLETLKRLADGDDVAIVLALHDLSLAAQFCDQLVCLSDGRVEAAGAPDEVLTPERMRRVYGVETDIEDKPGLGLRITALRAV